MEGFVPFPVERTRAAIDQEYGGGHFDPGWYLGYMEGWRDAQTQAGVPKIELRFTIYERADRSGRQRKINDHLSLKHPDRRARAAAYRRLIELGDAAGSATADGVSIPGAVGQPVAVRVTEKIEKDAQGNVVKKSNWIGAYAHPSVQLEGYARQDAPPPPAAPAPASASYPPAHGTPPPGMPPGVHGVEQMGADAGGGYAAPPAGPPANFDDDIPF